MQRQTGTPASSLRLRRFHIVPAQPRAPGGPGFSRETFRRVPGRGFTDATLQPCNVGTLRRVEDWPRLAREVDAEMSRQGLSGAALARRAGFSERTLYAILKVEQDSYHPETLARLESALYWETGSVERALSGRAPRRKPDVDLARLQHVWSDLPPLLRRTLADVAEGYLRRGGEA